LFFDQGRDPFIQPARSNTVCARRKRASSPANARWKMPKMAGSSLASLTAAYTMLYLTLVRSLRMAYGGPVRGCTSGCLWIACCLLAPPRAQAEARLEPFRVVYRPSEGCPDEATFVRWVLSRTRRARRADAGEPGRTFLVTLRREGQSFAGSLAIMEERGVTDTRAVRAESCDEVARALSLIFALAMDPEAGHGPETEPAQDPAPATAEKPPTVSSVPARRVPASLVREDKPRSTAAHDGMIAGVRLEVQGGVAPFPTWVPSLFVDAGLGRGFWFRAKLGAGQREASGDLELGTASFLYLGSRVDVCLCAGEGSWRAGPCVGVESGVVRARGIPGSGQLRQDFSRTSAWVEPMTTLTVAWRPVHWFETTLLGGVGFPLHKTEYYFEDPRDPVYLVPAAVAVIGLGAGVVFR
jgi:hypothetical protein